MALTDLDPSGNAESFANQASTSQYNPLNAVANGSGYLNNLANKYILKPASAQGLAGFVFDYEGSTEVVVSSEITDHYSEQNTFFNDQVAQKPQRVTLNGFVGEIVANANVGILGVLNTLQGKLTTLEAIGGKYTPSIVQKISAGVTSATTTVNKIDNAVSRAQNLVGLFIGSAPAPTKQELAYQNLYSLWSTNQVFTLVTPFNYFRSVVIEHMTFVQDELTKQWSEISVTVKEVRFTGVVPQGPGISAQLAAQSQQGRSQYSSQAQVNNGKTQGTADPFMTQESFF